jgi:ATP-dependent Lon protease
VVVFPHVVIPLLVGRAASLAAVDAAAAGDGLLLLVAQRVADVQDPASADLYRVGVVARVLQVTRLPSGTTKVLVEGISRARVTRYAPTGGILRATVADAPLETSPEDTEQEARTRQVITLFEEYVGMHRRIPAEIVSLVQGVDTPARQAYVVAAHLGVRHELRQALLEADVLTDLLSMLSELLAGELDLLRLERKIDDDVRGSLFQNQREFYLQEQLKAIHRELGEEDDDDFDELERQLIAKGLPEPIKVRALRELRRLRRMSTLSPEATVARGFLDWINLLPWTERTEDVLDVEHARRVLDEDHFGLEEVKDRILDFISVLALVKKLDGPILCLVGPPGVGKTSLGRSIARALGRKFVRMSLGGVRDEAEIRGHRRTYIGAMPGRLLQAMRRAEVVNPVILLDEVDKLGQDYRGDPSAALLEVLDPQQNRAFNDHYLEVDYDLSQVMFVTTANSLGGIPEPLRDRMEIIRLTGYLDQEKIAIARSFLIPRQLVANGLSTDEVRWNDDAVPAIIRSYTREAGVRELERRIGRIARKLARRRASGTATELPFLVDAAILPELLGPAPFDPDDTSLEDKVGVASGLAYTTVGGEVLEIEVSSVNGRGKLQLTGTLGDVMKESANAALSYARARAAALGIEREFYRTRDIHVHIPAGSTPKDGPSAGIAIATAIVSALTGVPVRGDIAMTGEITLRGRVLPIGGLKEKSVAAHRNGIAHVIIPQGNLRDVQELPQEVRDGVRFHPVRTMDEVLGIALRAHAAVGGAARPHAPPDARDATGTGAVAH